MNNHLNLKWFIFISTIFIAHVVQSQNTNYGVQQVNINSSKTVNNNYMMSDYATGMVVDEIANWRNEWTNAKKREAEQKRADAKITHLREGYKSANSYPDTISDGWHNVIATDNLTYANNCKVLVKDNQIIRVFIKNWIEIDFSSMTKIKKGKNFITWRDKSNNDYMVDIYFLYDLDEPRIVDRPLRPGAVTFWTSLGRYKSIRVFFEGKYIGNLSNWYSREPECGANGCVSFSMKPGVYTFKSDSRGSKGWGGSITISEDMCTLISLN